MPSRQQIGNIYEAHRQAVSLLVRKGRISSSDAAKLCRHGQYDIASEHWSMCDAGARSVLLNSHPHVASAARISQRSEANYDGAPYCSYGHKTKASCDCERIAANE